MLRSFTYLFLVVMTLFTVVPTVDQLWGKQVCSIAPVGSGMAEEEIKVFKEIHFFSYDLPGSGDAIVDESDDAPCFHYETLLSQLFVLLPDLPPDC